MKTGLSATAEPSSLPENFDPEYGLPRRLPVTTRLQCRTVLARKDHQELSGVTAGFGVLSQSKAWLSSGGSGPQRSLSLIRDPNDIRQARTSTANVN